MNVQKAQMDVNRHVLTQLGVMCVHVYLATVWQVTDLHVMVGALIIILYYYTLLSLTLLGPYKCRC